MSSWHSYPKILALGHRYIHALLTSPVVVEEKVDGSQFSFGVYGLDGEFNKPLIRLRSKTVEMRLDAPDKMFTLAAEWVKANAHKLRRGWAYRGEYLRSPKHNALAYDRVPNGHIMIFDINDAHESYLPYAEKKAEAERLGLECVPCLYEGMVTDIEQFKGYLDRVSVLGGQTIEGVVVKNYNLFNTQDGHAMMGKFVSEKFKETMKVAWKGSNPSNADVIQKLVDTYRTPTRWQKALIHLKEQGKIVGELKDIGTLMTEVWPDIVSEEEENIKQKLFDWAEDKIRRGVTAGLPQWYKEQLMEEQFNGDQNSPDDTPSPSL